MNRSGKDWSRAGLALVVTAGALLSAACAGHDAGQPLARTDDRAGETETIRCVLPGQIRQLGTDVTYLSASRVVTTSRADCEIRGGSPLSLSRLSPEAPQRFSDGATTEGRGSRPPRPE